MIKDVFYNLPPFITGSDMFMAMRIYFENNGINIVDKPRRVRCLKKEETKSFITWGNKLSHAGYQQMSDNILYMENGFLNQKNSVYMDSSGFFSDSSLVVDMKGQAPYTKEEFDDTRDSIIKDVEVDILNHKVNKDGPILVCLQMNRDATMRYYFPAARLEGNRVFTFLRLLKSSLKTDRDVLVRLHPKEKIVPNIDFPSNWSIDKNESFYDSLSNSSSVIAVNSTCVVEAMCYGIPVATFGNSIFSNQGLTVDSSIDYNKVNEVFDFVPDQEKVNRFLCAINRQCPKLDCSIEQYLTFFQKSEQINNFIKKAKKR